MSIINAGRVYDDSVKTIHLTESEYNALTPEQKQSDKMYLITDRPAEGNVLYIERLTKYSAEEQIVGIWTNGKPVYSRTVTGKTPVGSTANLVFSDSTIEELINASGKLVTINNAAGDYDWIFPNGSIYPYRRADGIYMFNASADSSWFNQDYVMTVEYTKTADAEGSGLKLLESGVGSAKDIYSTEETVVGTWIDGKPIYRIVRSAEIASSGTTYLLNSTQFSELNIDYVVRHYLKIDTHSASKNQIFLPYYLITSSSTSVVSVNAYIGEACSTRGFGAQVIGNISLGTDSVLYGILEYTKITDTATKEVMARGTPDVQRSTGRRRRRIWQ